MRAIASGAVVAALVAAFVVPSPAAQQRDTPVQSAKIGTAILAGTILSDDAGARPIRRARVTLNSSDKSVTLLAATDDEGRFWFRDVPGGRYSVQATKPAWLTANYGAKRPMRPGTPITLGDGQQLSIKMTMSRGAVVTGTIRRPNNEPAAGIQVGVLQYTLRGGERVLEPSGTPPLTVTDDTGTYRLFGLPPGETVVMAMVPGSANSRDPASFREMTPGMVDAAQQMARSGGLPLSATTPMAPGPMVSFAPVYYPGTVEFANAASFVIGAGEERTGIDVQLQLVPTATVEGTLVAADGTALKVGAVFLLGGSQPGGASGPYRFMQTGETGMFRFASIPSGTYTIRVAAQLKSAAPASADTQGGASPAVAWAMTDVRVDGHDLVVPLVLQPAMTVSGRVALEGGLQPKDLEGLRISVDGVGPVASLGSTTGDVPVLDGKFSISGVIPGAYQLGIHGPQASRWTIKSAVAAGQDTTDTPLAIGAGQSVSDWVVTITDQPNELIGSLQDASGRPATDYFVIVFAANRALWTPTSRRIAETRPSNTGAFSVRGLPAGEYLVAAVTDVQPGEWLSPAFLGEIASAAIKITVTEGQTTVQRLRVGGG